MAQVDVMVNGRSYSIACDDGQEDRIRRLGEYIDGKVADFSKKLGQIGDVRLLLMASLVVTDELADATDAIRRERARAANGGHAADDRSAAAEAVVAAGIESLALRIEAVAAQLEGTT